MAADLPTTIVIFGASGDLTHRKLGPALYYQFCKGRLPQNLRIVGFALDPFDHAAFRARLRDGIQKYASDVFDPAEWDAFSAQMWYMAGNLTSADDFKRLDVLLREKEGGPANRLYYLATSPQFFVRAIQNLDAAQMAHADEGWRRIVIEKPFGRDLVSARALNAEVHAVFDEQQVFRIDHYLGKETAQNLLFFRFANSIFEPLWNRGQIDHVQITVAEQVDVGHRAGYYDQAGVLRDMFQNHLLQLLALVTMEPPTSFEADAVRDEKVKVLRAIRPVDLDNTLRAQYDGYCETESVAPDSQTATFAVLKLYIDNWRWQGVPFYLRCGKALADKSSEIVIVFKCPPHLMFNLTPGSQMEPNILTLCIQPDEGMHLALQTKVPDSAQDMRPVDMEFHYRSEFEKILPDAYERLLLDALRGDASLFTRSDGIEAAWRVIDPILAGWQTPDAPPLLAYPRGSWGPPEADLMLADDGHVWRKGCGEHDYQEIG